MKKLFIIASCLLLSDSCPGCQKPSLDYSAVYKKRSKEAIAHQAMEYKFYELHDINRHSFLPIMDSPVDCPVPPTPPASPTPKEEDICPVPPTPPASPKTTK
jgi:hypothetical protein